MFTSPTALERREMRKGRRLTLDRLLARRKELELREGRLTVKEYAREIKSLLQELRRTTGNPFALLNDLE